MQTALTSIALDFPPLKKAMGIFGDTTPGVIPYFVIGEENGGLAELLSPTSIVELGQRSPIYFYGASGVGKTTVGLTMAGRFAMATGSQGITLTTGADFARLFGHSAESDDMDRFRARHRECDLLLLDGIHELVHKDSAQEELLYTLDALEERQRPAIVIGSKLAGSLRGLRAALVSRLMGGMSFCIQPPGLEARLWILQELNRQLHASLTDEELQELSQQLPGNSTALQLRGVLLQWIHQQRVAERREDALRTVIASLHQLRALAVMDIAKAVAKQLGVKMSDLKGDTRKANIVRARGLAMYLARQWTSMSLQQIGAFFGDRDHTTVLHAIRKIEVDLTADSDLSRALEEIRQSLNV